MGGTVLNTKCIQHTTGVRNEQLGFGRFRINRDHAVIHEVGTIGRVFVVDPEHDGLVDTIARALVHNVLFALKELLADHFGTDTSVDLLVHQERQDVVFGFLVSAAQLDTVTSGGVNRLDNERVLFGFQKGLDFLEGASCRLSDGPKSGRSDKFLLHFLVATVGDLGTIGQDAHVFRQGIGQVDAGFSTAHDGNNGPAIGVRHFLKGSGSFRQGLTFVHFCGVFEARATVRHMSLHDLAEALVPANQQVVATLLHFQSHAAAGTVRCADHNCFLAVEDGRDRSSSWSHLKR
mmetsp:Transcript_22138/g.35662  ORF Transcript_22138/g.35662 Transcript_22138/m.35662 type:complete len:291 (-) Transcript_22138:160-1032(-)